MHKLRRDIEFLEGWKQRVRTKLNRLQQDPIQTPPTSIAGLWPRELLEQGYHDHHDKDQDRVQIRHEHDKYDMCIDTYPTMEQINADFIWYRQLQEMNKYNLESKLIR